MHKTDKLFILFVCLMLIGINIFLYNSNLFFIKDLNQVIRSDGLGYFSWIGNISLNYDICFNSYHNYINLNFPQDLFTLKPVVQSNCFMPIYGIGMSIMWLPLFFTFFLLWKIFGSSTFYPFSEYSQLSIIFSNIIFAIIATYFIQKYLKLNNSKFRLLPIFFLIFSTPLLHYIVFDVSFSHTASFTIISIIIYLTESIHKKFRFKQLVLLGFFVFLLCLIRTSHLLILIYIYLILFKQIRIKKIKYSYLFIIFFFSVSAILIQVIIWSAIYGKLVFNPYYEYEGFNWPPINLLDLYFSYLPHGLFSWSPILIFAIFGMVKSIKFEFERFLAFFVYFAVYSLLIASWSSPYGGGGFGHRLFIDLYPIFILGLSKFFNSKLKSVFILKVGLSTVFLMINLYMMYLYWSGKISVYGVSISEYWDLIIPFKN